ncbi:MarR family transcriptional regulator [Oculatella sp. LEGE 06141]|uniref:MarR family transcriptional regulator n=1 Tax=Oculatella sp. LEGE 06141 TaxID=1828648 RepID=UPI001881E7C6|nr:MarR family transcriptional regulator [Oculatella sp. LEGE 06141]MBE9182279.1 MarR family transcriptional regulator [Oculatella sp. LEGE 06141]
MPENTPASFSTAQSDECIFAQEDDAVFFAEETELSQGGNWKILIVDDDVEVHEVTKLALSDFAFEEKSLMFISAFSAQEAKQLIQAHPDTAIVFLDVVMETDDAGLQVIPYIREELENPIVRIILRTGQPGQAPEDVVAVNYEIDDYKTKTELTSQKLFITVLTALRAFSTLARALEISQVLEQELAQYRQVGLPERNPQGNLQDENDWMGRSLSASASTLSRQHENIEALGQAVTDMTHDVVNAPNQSGAVHTMSIIARIARMVLRITDEHSATLGISQSKLAVLLYLSTEPERCASPSSLAKQCGVSRAAMTGLLDGLEQDGYVERDDHPSDRRALMVKLTPKGQQFLEWIAPQNQYQMSELMNSLDEAERQNLMNLVIRAIKLLDETVLAE